MPSTRVGFTLIELLVVMSIVALLIAVLLPALAQARKVALATRCATQMRQVVFGVLTYIENDRKTMMFGTGAHDITMSMIYYQGYFTSGFPQLGQPNQSESIFHCPDNPWPVSHANAFMHNSATSISSTHYGWTSSYRTDKPTKVFNSNDPRLLIRTGDIPNASRGVLLGETRYAANNPTRNGRGEGNSEFLLNNLNNFRGDNTALAPWKHNRRGNYAFYDGHVATFESTFILSNDTLANPSSPVRMIWPAGTY